MKDAVPNEWMKRTFFGDIDSTAQFLFQIDQQPPWEPRRRTRTGLYEEIDVAVLSGVTPGERAEHAKPSDAEASELRAVLAQERENVLFRLNRHLLPNDTSVRDELAVGVGAAVAVELPCVSDFANLVEV